MGGKMGFRGWRREIIVLEDGRRVEAICPQIISASRAMDLPAFHTDWFMERLRAGYAIWKNPFHAGQIQYVSLRHARACIFWSKNPRPLMPQLAELDARGLNYYFQFTLNDYEPEGLEPGLPSLAERIATFRELSRRIGPRRVIWRFDPLILGDGLTVAVLLERIRRIAEPLGDSTERLIFSFIDISRYRRVVANLRRAGKSCREFTTEEMGDFAGKLAAWNRDRGLRLASCAEEVDLACFGIERSRCIDDRLLRDLFSHDRDLMDFLGPGATGRGGDSSSFHRKDPGQRRACGCIAAKDIGTYSRCLHACVYCYASHIPGPYRSMAGRFAAASDNED